MGSAPRVETEKQGRGEGAGVWPGCRPARPDHPHLPGPRDLTLLPGAQIPACARPLARAPLQAHVPPPRAPRLGREGGLGSPEKGRARAAAGAGEGRAGRGATRRGGLGCACSSRLLGAEPRAAGPATPLGDRERDWGPARTLERPPLAPSAAAPPPAPASRPPRAPETRRAAPRRAGEPGRGERGPRTRAEANAGPWGAQTCGACGLRKVSPGVAGGCGGWESLCLGTDELRFAKYRVPPARASADAQEASWRRGAEDPSLGESRVRQGVRN